MRKEVFLAIFAGIGAGLVLAFGVWRLTSNLKKDNPQPSENPTPGEHSPGPVNGDLSITLSSPNNFDVVTDSPIKISGLTKPDAIVIVSTESKDYMTTAEKDGSFETEVSLSGGLNNLVVSSFDETGKSVVARLNLVYSSEFSKYLDSGEQVSDASESADTIREKVQQKLNQTLHKPTAYIGTITDITDSTIQTKSDENGIEQISISDDTSYGSDEELAIGDFILAMGYLGNNKVLDAKRIISAERTTPNSTEAIWANITTIDGKDVSFTNLEGKEYQIDFPKTWQGPDIKNLEEGQYYIITGNIVDTDLSLRSIFEIQK